MVITHVGYLIVIQISNELGYPTGIMTRKKYNSLEELDE